MLTVIDGIDMIKPLRMLGGDSLRGQSSSKREQSAKDVAKLWYGHTNQRVLNRN